MWRSVLAAQGIIKEGAACRVGSGVNMSVLKDPWLSILQNPYVTTSNIFLEGTMVSSLFVTGENRWDEDLIHDMFEERDVNLILSIPLDANDQDVWYWKMEKLGHYSVKSAYVLLQMQKNIPSVESHASCWKRLWALRIPPKVKHLMWRAITGCLPAKSQLHQKHVDVNVICFMCNQEPETIDHVLLYCSFANGCLRQMEGINSSVSCSSFGDWFVSVFDRLGSELRRQAAMLCWAIWKCRNDLVWNQ